MKAAEAVGAIGKLHSLIYVDWAWGYICEAQDERAFASTLRTKLESIASNQQSRDERV